MLRVSYTGDKRAEKLSGKQQTVKQPRDQQYHDAARGAIGGDKGGDVLQATEGKMTNPDFSLSPTFQTPSVPLTSQMQQKTASLQLTLQRKSPDLCHLTIPIV